MNRVAADLPAAEFNRTREAVGATCPGRQLRLWQWSWLVLATDEIREPDPLDVGLPLIRGKQ